MALEGQLDSYIRSGVSRSCRLVCFASGDGGRPFGREMGATKRLRRLAIALGLLAMLGVVAAQPATALQRRADLSIVMTGPATVLAGANISYPMTVTNNGPDAAQGVSVSDALPLQTTLVSFVQNSGPPTGGTLPAGGTMTLILVLTASARTTPGPRAAKPPRAA